MNFWNARLDQIRQRFELRSELELSITLRMHPASVAHIRSGLRAPSVANAIRILDKSGYVLTRDLFVRVLPQQARVAIAKADRRRALDMGLVKLQTQPWVASQRAADGLTSIDWVAAINELKVKLKIRTEVELAKHLEINSPALAQIRQGSRALPATAKINLLAELGIELDDEALLLALSEDIQMAVLRDTSAHGLVNIRQGEQDPNKGFDLDIPEAASR